jgi:uncharacterized protein (TIGR04168 family)
LRFAVIGDVHGCWADADTEYFNGAGYDALLFVGDLPPLIGSLPVACKLAKLRVPAFLIPGNHDAVTAPQFLAELKQRRRLAGLLSVGQARREAKLREALGPVKLVGYSLDVLDWSGRPLGLLAVRPYSMGGDRIYFLPHLKRQYGVASFEDSTAKLRALIDRAPHDLIVLSHNGPAGLGNARDDIFGCDFARNGGDFGDPDLRDAIAYALQGGRRVHAVMSGHMHHRLKRGGFRRHWQMARDGVLYVNAARVRRIKAELRHHVALTLDAEGARAEALWIDSDGKPSAAPD